MTIIHVLNYSIPIGFMAFFGFLLDKMCKVDSFDKHHQEKGKTKS
ncbi:MULTISPECIES: hypothetical protein [unclassified Bacillus (in: firmicutes)]|nr:MULTISPECIES: hypothetical protein [unclassified Bacillus (in: firmicutes)]SFB08729.1 hypothetical protein SAMN02799634_105197 [Bacillus sp. UNCCL13]SFQ86967.1 hypothetical protein SAMN04488577_2925 [Bacillus sp. cl95]